MKIIVKGNPPPSRPWMKKNWKCYNCNSVVYLDEEDNGRDIQMHDDQRDGVWITMECPVCQKVENFYEWEEGSVRD